MKRIIISAAAVIVVLLGTSFDFAGRAAKDVRKLDPFDGIGVSVHADVFYTQGNNHEIKIEGADRDVKDLITEVRDGFLQIKYENWKIKRSKVIIHVTSSELEAVKMSGSGQFKAEKPVNSEEMDVTVSGSGGILFSKLNSEEVDVKISGSGSAKLLDGSAEELDVKLSGSGKLLAEKFEVSECSAKVSGSGSVKITVRDELDAKISGSGKVYYHGDPQVNSTSTGSGKVIEL